MTNERILNSKDDFDWYCKELDVRGKYKYDHNGLPDEYPCKVVSTWNDDPNGPYYYDHEFIYRKERKCPCCGHTTIDWDYEGFVG